MALTSLQAQFANWLVLDRATKRHLGMPTAEKDWAADHGVDPRTTRRWKKLPEFEEYRSQRQQDLAMSGAVSAVPTVEPVKHARSKKRFEEQPPPESPIDQLSEGREQYESIRDATYRTAMDGDSNALGTWMKHWGTVFLEEERRALEGRFPEMDDDELIDATLELIGTRRVAAWLKPRLADAGR